MKKRREFIFRFSAEDEQRLKELQDVLEAPSLNETARQVIRLAHKNIEKEDKENTKELTLT